MFWILLACTEVSLAPGEWLAGDLHVHSSVGSDDTDGKGTLEALAPAMQRAGLDWVVLTDHSNGTGSMHCDDVELCPNQGPEGTSGIWPSNVYMGSEISPVAALGAPNEPTGHIGCISPNGRGFEATLIFEDRPTGTVTGGDALAQCHAANGYGILNHPFGPAPWVAYDWTSEAYDAMEVYNGGARFDATDAQAVVKWEEDLAAGKRVLPVGGSDSHQWGQLDPTNLLAPPLGWPVTWVHVRKDETPLDALFAGRIVIAEPGTSLRIEAAGRRKVVGPGESIRGTVRITLQASTVSAERVLELRRIGDGTVGVWTLGEDELSVTVEAQSGIYYARVYPVGGEVLLGEAGIALTAPIWVE